MKKVFLSLPMSGRTQENIEFTIKAMTKRAKEILGEDIEVSHLANVPKAKVDNLPNPGIYNMVLATAGMLHCDYFMGFTRSALNLLGTVTHSKHYGCILEEDLWLYGQRHGSMDIVKLNGYVTSCKRLPMVGYINIQDFVPELGSDEKVYAAKLLLNSTFGMHGGLHMAYVPKEWKVDKAELVKGNHELAGELVRGARSKVETFDDVLEDLCDIGNKIPNSYVAVDGSKEEANDGKEENN